VAQFPLPWQAAHREMDTGQELFNFLTDHPMLLYCKIGFDLQERAIPEDSLLRSICLNHLTFLSFQGFSRSLFAQLLQRLRTPSLEHLDMIPTFMMPVTVFYRIYYSCSFHRLPI